MVTHVIRPLTFNLQIEYIGNFYSIRLCAISLNGRALFSGGFHLMEYLCSEIRIFGLRFFWFVTLKQMLILSIQTLVVCFGSSGRLFKTSEPAYFMLVYAVTRLL